MSEQKILNEEQFNAFNSFGRGTANTIAGSHFIGNSYVNVLTSTASYPLFSANVTFEPGCRNAWHIHHASEGGGQLLFCIAGSGWYQEEGKPAVSLNPGDVMAIPANVKHWHGAKK
ncbi:MAG: cupin domain-containing protein, partial [Bulleidia sp.]